MSRNYWRQEREMGKADSVEAGDGRLSAQLAATLEPKLQDALDHPVRREVLRVLVRGERLRSVTELGAELPGFRLSQLSYHLQVLRRMGTVASEVAGDGRVRAVLRATEQWDRARREAAAAASASPLLTMFRVPRPGRTIRLRSRGKIDSEREL